MENKIWIDIWISKDYLYKNYNYYGKSSLWKRWRILLLRQHYSLHTLHRASHLHLSNQNLFKTLVFRLSYLSSLRAQFHCQIHWVAHCCLLNLILLLKFKLKRWSDLWLREVETFWSNCLLLADYSPVLLCLWNEIFTSSSNESLHYHRVW